MIRGSLRFLNVTFFPSPFEHGVKIPQSTVVLVIDTVGILTRFRYTRLGELWPNYRHNINCVVSFLFLFVLST